MDDIQGQERVRGPGPGVGGGVDFGELYRAVRYIGEFKPSTNVEGLVSNGLLFKFEKIIPTTEQKALDALGIAVLRELGDRLNEIQRLQKVEQNVYHENAHLHEQLQLDNEHHKNQLKTTSQTILAQKHLTNIHKNMIDEVMSILLPEGSDRVAVERLAGELAARIVAEDLSSGLGDRAQAYLTKHAAEESKSDATDR